MKLHKEILECQIQLEETFNLANITDENSIFFFNMNSISFSLNDKYATPILDLEIPQIKKKRENIDAKKIRYTANYEKRLNSVQTFFTKHFQIHNVSCLNSKQKIVQESPFNIAISKKNYEESIGYIKLIVDYSEKKHQIIPIFTKIELPEVYTKYIPITYAHEITHTQLYGVNQSIINFLNNEVLPIFIEYLYLSENGNEYLIAQHNFYRINDLKRNLIIIQKYYNEKLQTDSIYINAAQYFISHLTAYKLFSQYNRSTLKEKKIILSEIQNVFDGNLTLEDMLDNHILDWTKSKTKKRF